MCTVSWSVAADTYEVFFNRDENRGRQPALAPQCFTVNDVQVLMPIDPVGQGSWIATNAHGISIALLNYYQGCMPEGELISRGQIIRQLAGLSSLAEVEHFMQDWPLVRSAPFSLLVFDPGAKLNCVPLFRWTGERLLKSAQISPLISSAVEYESVLNSRLEQFAEKDADLQQLHRSHRPCRSAYSICMHRSDAHTVSFTHISVNHQRVAMSYQPDAPCKGRAPVVSTLPRV